MTPPHDLDDIPAEDPRVVVIAGIVVLGACFVAAALMVVERVVGWRWLYERMTAWL